MKLPEDWHQQSGEVASFKYEHPARGQRNEEFYFKILHAGGKLEVNALSSIHNEVFSSEFM